MEYEGDIDLFVASCCFGPAEREREVERVKTCFGFS